MSGAVPGASRPRLSYRPDIDGLRAVAVLAVLAYHAFPGTIAYGFYGVDVFFVISGYLITGLLLHRPEAGNELGRFYARRIRRLFPAMLVVLPAALAAGFVVMRGHEYAVLQWHVLASLGFVENFLLAAEAGYFDTVARGKPLLHFWSLAVEEQFYLIWPVLIALFARRRAAIAVLVTFAIVASFALAVSGAVEQSFYSPLTRAWELGVGAALAMAGPRVEQLAGNFPRSRDAASALALAALGIGLVWSPFVGAHPGIATLIPVVATATLIATGPAALANRLALSRREAVGIGLISYPLYLWHWPLLAFPFLVLGAPAPAAWRIAALAASLLLAWATWRFVERPLRFGWPVRRAVTFLVGAALALAAATPLFVLLHARMGPPHEAEIEEQLAGLDWRYNSNALCEARIGTGYRLFCIQNRPGPPTMMLLGDSMANHLYPGLIADPRTRDETILSYGWCAGSMIDVSVPQDCARQDAIVAETPTIHTLIFSAAWPRFDDRGRMVDNQTGDRTGYEKAPNLPEFEARLMARMQKFAAEGRRLVLFAPKPDLGYDISDCYPRPLFAAQRTCSISRAQADAETGNTRRMLARVARATGAELFDQLPFFCDARFCRYQTAEGLPLLRDANHYSELGSAMIIDRWLASRE